MPSVRGYFAYEILKNPRKFYFELEVFDTSLLQITKILDFVTTKSVIIIRVYMVLSENGALIAMLLND